MWYEFSAANESVKDPPDTGRVRPSSTTSTEDPDTPAGRVNVRGPVPPSFAIAKT
jgi:hypothetical protein